VPSAPTAIGTPDQVLVPVMLAAMMLPTARPIAWPVLPQTWATNSVAISLTRTEPRRDVSVRACMSGRGPGGIVSRPLGASRF
jgi:hypothetical protein